MHQTVAIMVTLIQYCDLEAPSVEELPNTGVLLGTGYYCEFIEMMFIEHPFIEKCLKLCVN